MELTVGSRTDIGPRKMNQDYLGGWPELGLFVVADGGTLFLDEIGELPRSLQSRPAATLRGRSVSTLPNPLISTA